MFAAVTSLLVPPIEFHLVPLTSGSASTGERVPQSVRKYVPASELPQRSALAHSTGNCAGTGVDWKLMFTSPASVLRKSANPAAGDSSPRSPNSSQETRKLVPERALSA